MAEPRAKQGREEPVLDLPRRGPATETSLSVVERGSSTGLTQRGGLRAVCRTKKSAHQPIEPVEPTRVPHGKHRQGHRDIKKILKVTPVAARRRGVELARVAEDPLEGGKIRQSIDFRF